jgi:hypothetical protein
MVVDPAVAAPVLAAAISHVRSSRRHSPSAIVPSSLRPRESRRCPSCAAASMNRAFIAVS